MTIRYPNGNPYKDGTQFSPDAVSRPTIYGGRGMTLEEELNLSNQYYRSIDKAVVYKKPTPVQIVEGKLTTLAEVGQLSVKPILRRLPQLIIMVCIAGIILTLKPKKPKIRPVFR